MPILTATSLARNLSEDLNQVRYQHTSFDIQRGNDVIARLAPAARVSGYPIAQLSGFFASLPALDDAEADAMLADIHAATDALLPEPDAWAS